MITCHFIKEYSVTVILGPGLNDSNIFHGIRYAGYIDTYLMTARLNITMMYRVENKNQEEI